MALRQLPPLDKIQWEFVIKNMGKKPSEQQKKRIKEVVALGRKIKTHHPSIK
jgi:uncharacterized protein YneF (UPF0154 family)